MVDKNLAELLSEAVWCKKPSAPDKQDNWRLSIYDNPELADRLLNDFARHRLAASDHPDERGGNVDRAARAGGVIGYEAGLAEGRRETADERGGEALLDSRCGFSGPSVFDTGRSSEWLAACEHLATRFDYWKLNDKAAQIRAGNPGWLIEQACVEAVMAALSTPAAPEPTEAGEWREALAAMVALYDTDDGCRSLPQVVAARTLLAARPSLPGGGK